MKQPAGGERRAVLAARGLTKRYGGVTVLDHVDLDVEAGEVRALLGENGAGKSTLIKILSGVVAADDGEVHLDGELVSITDPRSAMDLGIATLHQELSIVPGLSVAENATLGQPLPRRFGKVRWKVLAERAEALFAELGQDIDVRRTAEHLSPVERTMTALARALAQDSRLLILDEPTAALTDAETTRLFGAMRRLADAGAAILYVSHRLDEVMEVCDTYTVLRNGLQVAEGDLADISVEEVITAMAGRRIEAIFPERQVDHGDVVLEVRGLSGRRARGVDFDVRAGEVFGIAGLAGSGRSEVVRMLAGAQARRGGEVILDGEHFEPGTVGAGHRSGVALVPQERRTEGVVPDSIERNANITTVDRHAHGGVVVSGGRARRHADRLMGLLDVRHRALGQEILTLSGGNQQKVVLAKFLAIGPRLLLLDEPTRGVDVATKSEIYHLIAERAAEGLAVVVVSSELPELLGIADRILVMREGHPVGTFLTADTDEAELLHACYGRAS
ncbi:MAG: sugar ABC transporter ATP-binding protein [Actinomycetota bacterium]